jgi:hypothetical protein
MRLETKTGWTGQVTIRHWWEIWRAQPEAERPAFVEDCIGYLKLDFLALCEQNPVAQLHGLLGTSPCGTCKE